MPGDDSMAGVVAGYGRAGFEGQFASRPGGRVLCLTCRVPTAADAVHLLALHRFEGESDPGEEAAVAALECPACKTRGTMVLTYGVGAGADDAAVLAHLLDRRGESGIRPGL